MFYENLGFGDGRCYFTQDLFQSNQLMPYLISGCNRKTSK